MKNVIVIAFSLVFCFYSLEVEAKTSNDTDKIRLEYFEENSKTDNKEILRLLIEDVSAWLMSENNSVYGDSILLLKAQIEQKLSLYKESALTLIKHRFIYPKSKNAFNVKSLLNSIVDKKITKNLRQTSKDLSEETPPVSAKEDKIAYFLTSLSRKTDNYFYDALMREFYDFFAKYPHYSKMDAVILALGNLEASNKNYYSAMMQYDKIEKFYPKSDYLAQSKLMIAKIKADTKEYNEAMGIYQTVADKFPDTKWAAAAFGEMADIAERQKQYSLALEVYDKIIKAYPKDDFAYKAMISKADIYEKLNHFEDAIKVLKETGKIFEGERAILALLQAAEIAGEKLKDYNIEADIYGTLADRYPDSLKAPQALYKTGYIYETRLENPAKAKVIYKKLIGGYPGNTFSLKAQERLEKFKE